MPEASGTTRVQILSAHVDPAVTLPDSGIEGGDPCASWPGRRRQAHTEQAAGADEDPWEA